MNYARKMLPAYGLCLLWTVMVMTFALLVWNPGEGAATAAFVAIPGAIGNAAILLLWTRRVGA